MPTTPPSMTPTPTPAPARNDRSTFSTRMDSFVTWCATAVAEFVAALTNCYNNSVDANNSAISAASNAGAASTSAANAATYANAALAAADYKGNWSALSGALNVPASCTHNGLLWYLNTNTTNVASDQPGVSSKWTMFPSSGITIAREQGGTAYPLLLGTVCPPTLDINAFDYINEPNGCHPSITFTRASVGTRYNHFGNLEEIAADIIRHDYDPVTGEYKGWLLETGRTNLLTYSEQLDHANWTKTNATITADTAAGPDGTTTMDKLVETTATGLHTAHQVPSITVTNPYTRTVFGKIAEKAKIYLQFISSPTTTVNASVKFDANTGAFSSPAVNGGATQSYSAKQLLSGIWRAIQTITLGGADTAATHRHTLLSADETSSSYTGDGSSGFILVGSQLEAGAYATSYIKTTSAAVARAADSAIISGAAFTDFFNPTEGTLLFVGDSNSNDGTNRGYIGFDDNTANNAIGIFGNVSNNIAGQIVIGGVVTALGSTSYTNGNKFVAAISYKNNDCAFAVNGSIIGSSASISLPTVDRLRIGGYRATWQIGCGHTQRVIYFPRRLNNQLLQLLTGNL